MEETRQVGQELIQTFISLSQYNSLLGIWLKEKKIQNIKEKKTQHIKIFIAALFIAKIKCIYIETDIQ